MYLIPNLLSQAVILNKYVEKIQAYDEQKNSSGILYMYSLMFRKVFVFDIPEFDEDLYLDYEDSQEESTNSVSKKHSLHKLSLPAVNVSIIGNETAEEKKKRDARRDRDQHE